MDLQKSKQYLKRKMLEQQASKLLRNAGLDWSGRGQEAVDPKQLAFERKLLGENCGRNTPNQLI